MSPKKSTESKEEEKARRAGVARATQFTPPEYKDNPSCAYVQFYAFDPAANKMRLFRKKLNRIKGRKERRQYAKQLVERYNYQLCHGWNPWIARQEGDLTLFADAMGMYEAYLEKMMASGLFRKETYVGYKSYTKNLREYVKDVRPITYLYQFDRNFCVDFLDHIFIERDNSAQTRNNYLGYLRVLSGYFVQKSLMATRPTEGIKPISKRLITKTRTTIPLEVVGKIADYCKKNDPHFLLACYLLYYSFIRPVEMTRLKVGDISVKDSTLLISGENSKNRKTQAVTLPKKVLFYIIDLGILSRPSTDYVFSDKLMPGPNGIDPKIFRDHWGRLRKDLKLRPEWKFYSLKDTGITAMCEQNIAAIEVRDQARHSSLAITDIYASHKNSANEHIIGLDGAL